MYLFNNKKNRIYEYNYDGKTCYCVETYDGQGKAIFDHDDMALAKMIAELATGKSCLYVNKNRRLVFWNKEKRSSKTLSSFLFEVYHPEKEKKGKVENVNGAFVDENVQDCRSCNLFQTGDIVPYTNSRHIDILTIGEMKCISVLMMTPNERDYFDYSEGLYKLLATPSVASFFIDQKSRRGKVTIHRGEDCLTVFLYQLAYYWYHGLIDENDYYGSIERAQEQLKGMTIDHLNSDVRNNCSYNLSLMSPSANRAKYNISNIVQSPSFIYGVVHDGAYYLKIGNAGLPDVYIWCEDEDELLKCLRTTTGRAGTMFRGLRIRYVSDGGIVSAPTTFCSGSSSVGRNFETDCLQAQKLLSMPVQAFRKWETVKEFSANLEKSLCNMLTLIGVKNTNGGQVIITQMPKFDK